MSVENEGRRKVKAIQNLRLDHTERGFGRVEFIDDYGKQCSLQKSSSAEGEKIWLGMNNPELKYLIQGRGWQDYKLPFGVEGFSRMHLTQEQVKELLPYLERFVETGEL